jgi:DNA-binding PadR family transcriptional regulator
LNGQDKKGGVNKAINRLLINMTVRTLWIYVLATLREGPTYPYHLKKIIRQKFSFSPPTVTLYTVVYKLEKDGLIEKTPDGMYRITEEGANALDMGSRLLLDMAHRVSRLSASAVTVEEAKASSNEGPQ